MREVTTAVTTPPASIWEGIYPTFAAARGTQQVFESTGWLERLAAGHRKRAQSHAAGALEPPITTEYIFYPVAAATAGLTRPLRILDFSGGLANALYPLLAHLGTAAAFELHVVENAAVCDYGRSLVRDARVAFHEALPVTGHFDIVHAGSSLLYVEDWQGAVAQFRAYTPTHLILVDVPAGAVARTIATRQHHYGATIPCWLFRLDELRTTCEDGGYRITFDGRFRRPYFGQDVPPLMAALPTEFRLDSFRQLMFSRTGPT